MAKRIIIVGAGPGGLTAGMLLAQKGYQVDLFEKNPEVGGRNAPLRIGEFTFDTGPTFLMMVRILEEIFTECGKRLEDYLVLKKIDPLYRLSFPGGIDFSPSDDEERMVAEIDRVFPGEGLAYRSFKRKEGLKFDVVYPCLKVPYGHRWDYLKPRFLKALPRLDPLASVYDRLSSYFRSDYLKLAMTFQAKYLGMSPWQCPATFTIIPIIEHRWGLFHPIGGLNAISQAMGKAIEEAGGKIHLSNPVQEVLVRGGKAVGVTLADGRVEEGEALVLNPDFAWAMRHLVKAEHRRKYGDKKIASMDYSCSTFMLYLALDRRYDIPHHNIVFAKDYRQNIEEIVTRKALSADPSFYLQNASVTDPTLAPPGKSALYVLVPVSNQTSGIDWDKEKTGFRNRIVALIKERTELNDLDQHILGEKVITPRDWERDYHVYQGATFNLSHRIGQMLYFRPHNRFEEFGNCYLVGGGTHPGSGLPTIFQSGRIAAQLIGETI